MNRLLIAVALCPALLAPLLAFAQTPARPLANVLGPREDVMTGCDNVVWFERQ